jgi:hypothetical protein
MTTLLEALLRNESGGRNIANTTQGTSSGQAQGYFQITEGTWNDFGGGKYAKNPLNATYEQQADIASKIPLVRWDPSTIAQMQATGRPVDPSRTLGENLAMNAENFTVPTSAVGGLMSTTPTAAPQGFQPAFGDIVASNEVPLTPYGDDINSLGLGFLKQAEERRDKKEQAEKEAEADRRRALFAQTGLGGLYG